MNIVKHQICFNNSENPTVIDLIVTNVPKRLCAASCIETGLSDFHSLVCFSTKMNVPHNKPTHITYRPHTHFKEEKFLLDVSRIPFQVCEIF